MAAGTTKRPIARRRNRKRKRRNISSSSSSSSSEVSSSASSDSENEKEREREPTTVKLPQKRPPAAVTQVPAAATTSLRADESSNSSLDSATSDTDSESELEPSTSAQFHKQAPNASPAAAKPASEPAAFEDEAVPHSTQKHRASSPPPPQDVPAPNILDGDKTHEEALRARFRQFWLGCVADAFADDLNEIRKEPNLTPSRLSLLIDSLAAGADVYATSTSSSSRPSDPDRKQVNVNEMEVVLDD